MRTSEIPVMILCGGLGTRLREASEKLPKPLVDIGGKPILWHIMKLYSSHGYRRFVLCLGYKSELIKRYFLDYQAEVFDFTLHMTDSHRREFHNSFGGEDWEVTFVETGLLSGTGARIRRAAPYLNGASTFMLTYGDGIGDVDLTRLLERHRAGGRIGTVTAVHPSSRYGEMKLDSNLTVVSEFNEKPTRADGWVSGGFFAFEHSFIHDYLDEDPDLSLERKPLQRLASDGQLSVNPHDGFWMGMDTFRDWTELNQLWDRGEAPWRVWTSPTPHGAQD